MTVTEFNEANQTSVTKTTTETMYTQTLSSPSTFIDVTVEPINATTREPATTTTKRSQPKRTTKKVKGNFFGYIIC